MTEEQKKTLAFAIYALANYDIPLGEFLERSLVCINETLSQGQTLPIDSVSVTLNSYANWKRDVNLNVDSYPEVVLIEMYKETI
mgnify:CR=1 FL=1|tara:strand:- start:13555 stop:13806 length:252 start_codon:yes stop_codon:yes gene_type:complete